MTITVVSKSSRLIAMLCRPGSRDPAPGSQISWVRRAAQPLLDAQTAFRALLQDQQCATAVEFGLVSLPFFATLGAIIQFTFMIWAQQNLDFALQGTARSLFTGQFQTANNQASGASLLLDSLKKSMCGSGTSSSITVFDCSNLKIDVSLGTSFAASTPTPPIDPGTKDWAAGFGTHYACAPAGSIVVVTAAVKFPAFFNLLNVQIADFNDGSVLLQSTQVFRTEPYGIATC